MALALVLLIAAACFGYASISSTYELGWRMNFAEKRFDVAQSVSDGNTQHDEISRALYILDVFPKEGNYDFFNKVNPETDFGEAWKVADELRAYSKEISRMDKSEPAYQVALDNIQKKISFFRSNFNGAFKAYVYYGHNGWLGDVSVLLFILSALFGLLALFESRQRYLFWMFVLIILIIAIIAAFSWYIHVAPIYYAGPT